MNVVKEIGGAVAGVKAYPNFLKNKKGKVFWYGVLVVTIFFLLANVRGIIGCSTFLAGFEALIMDNVPDFSVKNGAFYIEEPFYLDEEGLLVMFDSNQDIVSAYSEDEWKYELIDYDSAIILDAHAILAKSDGKIQMAEWPAEFDFDRSSLVNFQPIMVICVVVFYLFSYLWGIAMYFFAALFVALVGMLIASTQKYKFTFGQIYLLSIYAKTLPLFIKGLCKLLKLTSLPLVGTLVGWGGFALACVYLGYAMAQIHKANNSSPYDGQFVEQNEYPYVEQ